MAETGRPAYGGSVLNGCSEWWLYELAMQIRDLVRGRCVKTCMAFLSFCSAANIFTFSAFLNDLKIAFSLKQQQAEFVMSMSFLGLGGACFVGYFAQRLGIKKAAILAWALAVSSNLLIWSATYTVSFYSDHSGLLALYFFMSGAGSGAIFLVSISAMLAAYDADYHGRVIGFLMTGYNIGIIVYISLYGAFFYEEDSREGESNLRGYFLLITATLAATNGPGAFIYGPSKHPLDDDDDVFLPDETTHLTESNEGQPVEKASTENQQKPSSIKDWALCSLFRNRRFHYLMWPTCIMMSLQPLNEGNLSIYLASLDLEQYSTVVPYVSPISSIVVDLFIGYASDRFTTTTNFNRPRLILAGVAMMALTFPLAIFLFDILGVMMLCLILWDISVMVILCNAPVLLLRDFGEKYFSTVWGLVYLFTSLVIFGLQNLFALFYENAIVDDDSSCYGLACFTTNFVISIFLCGCSAAFIVAYIQLKRR